MKVIYFTMFPNFFCRFTGLLSGSSQEEGLWWRRVNSRWVREVITGGRVVVEEGQLKVSNRGSTQGRRLLGSHIDLVRKGVIYSYTYTASRCMKIDGQQSFSRSKYLPKRKRQMSSIFISVHCSVPTVCRCRGPLSNMFYTTLHTKSKGKDCVSRYESSKMFLFIFIFPILQLSFSFNFTLAWRI